MRALAALFVLFLLACARQPTPEDVAGVYTLQPAGGETVQMPRRTEVSYELRADGTIHETFMVGERHGSVGDAEFLIRGRSGGCIELVGWPETDPDRRFVATICGDTLTFRPNDTERRPVERTYLNRG